MQKVNVLGVPPPDFMQEEEIVLFAEAGDKFYERRLTIAVQAVAATERALEEAIPYVKQREVFGQKLIEFQNTQFKRAECKTTAVTTTRKDCSCRS